MATKRHKPTSPARRGLQTIDYSELDSNDLIDKRLLVVSKEHSGRNNKGQITVRHRGGHEKRKYRGGRS